MSWWNIKWLFWSEVSENSDDFLDMVVKGNSLYASECKARSILPYRLPPRWKKKDEIPFSIPKCVRVGWEEKANSYGRNNCKTLPKADNFNHGWEPCLRYQTWFPTVLTHGEKREPSLRQCIFTHLFITVSYAFSWGIYLKELLGAEDESMVLWDLHLLLSGSGRHQPSMIMLR